MGVATSPGATALTQMPAPAYVAAEARINPSTPALAAAIASWFDSPICAAHDDNRTTLPPVSFMDVDQKAIRLPDGRVRLFTMKKFDIFSFISVDGRHLTLEPGTRFVPATFSGLSLTTPNDLSPVRLAYTAVGPSYINARR